MRVRRYLAAIWKLKKSASSMFEPVLFMKAAAKKRSKNEGGGEESLPPLRKVGGQMDVACNSGLHLFVAAAVVIKRNDYRQKAPPRRRYCGRRLDRNRRGIVYVRIVVIVTALARYFS
jgi:hypothetical protein